MFAARKRRLVSLTSVTLMITWCKHRLVSFAFNLRKSIYAQVLETPIRIGKMFAYLVGMCVNLYETRPMFFYISYVWVALKRIEVRVIKYIIIWYQYKRHTSNCKFLTCHTRRQVEKLYMDQQLFLTPSLTMIGASKRGFKAGTVFVTGNPKQYIYSFIIIIIILLFYFFFFFYLI